MKVLALVEDNMCKRLALNVSGAEALTIIAACKDHSINHAVPEGERKVAEWLVNEFAEWVESIGSEVKINV